MTIRFVPGDPALRCGLAEPSPPRTCRVAARMLRRGDVIIHAGMALRVGTIRTGARIEATVAPVTAPGGATILKLRDATTVDRVRP